MSLDHFEGPFRTESADGTLVYLDWNGVVEWEGPRVRPDIFLPPEKEPGRWWRHHPLSSEIAANLDRGLTLACAADSAGVPVEVAARFVRQ